MKVEADVALPVRDRRSDASGLSRWGSDLTVKAARLGEAGKQQCLCIPLTGRAKLGNPHSCFSLRSHCPKVSHVTILAAINSCNIWE